MKRITPLGLLLLVLLSVGCHGADPVTRTYHNTLVESHDAIVRGQTAEARQHLAKAKQLAGSERVSPAVSELLMAEVMLREDKASEALALARKVVKRVPNNPRAHEVFGKAVLLSGGPFNEAERAFVAAKSGYTRKSDQRRAGDLLVLARGLSAYAAGDPEVARKYFKKILDPDLRFRVDKAAREAAQNGLVRR